MTFDEAEAHIGRPVLIGHAFASGGMRHGEIVEVDRARGMVAVRVRRKTAPYDWLTGRQWWHPAHLSVPRWWSERQSVRQDRV